MIMWPTKKITDVCENLDSSRIPITKSKRVIGKTPYYGASGIVDYVDDHIFDEDLLLVSEDGANLLARTYPIAFSISGKTWVNNHAHVLRFESKSSQQFVEYYLNSISLSPFVTGMAQPKLNQKSLNNLSVPFPPIPEQKRIVAILDQAFADIDKARANAEQNLKNARELFESYLQQVFSQRGEGWKVSKLIDIANVVDSLHKTPKYSEDGYPMVRVTDVRSGSLDLSNTRKVDKSTYDEFSKKYKAKIGDIVFSRVGSYGRSSIVTTDEPFCLGQNTVFLAPSIDGYYFYYFLNSQYAKDQIDKLVSGSTQPTVSLKSIKSIDVPVPPEHKQLSIVKKVDGMSKKIIQVEELYLKKLDALDELKKSILQKAFIGELTRAVEETESKGAAA